MANQVGGLRIKLNSGHECPLLGYGTWQSTDEAKLKEGVKAAVKAGYRHIDTAHIYGNEHVIGQALDELYSEGVVKRQDLFLVTKLWNTHHHPDVVEAKLKQQLAKLKTDYIDLYLIHFPVPFKHYPDERTPFKDGKVEVDMDLKIEDTWRAMEGLVEKGLARSIGVSNFAIPHVERLLKMKIPPAMNQFEVHPGFQNQKLVDYCQAHGVVVTGYSSFGSPGTTMGGRNFTEKDYLNDPTLLAIGKKYGKTAAHVILRWSIQRQIVVIPKSVTPSRIVDNFNIWDFELTGEDMATIKAMDENRGRGGWKIPGLDLHPDFPFFDEGSC